MAKGRPQRNTMPEHTIPSSEIREKFATILEQVDSGRVLITHYGKERAYLISVRELRALEETIAILEKQEVMAPIMQALRSEHV